MVAVAGATLAVAAAPPAGAASGGQSLVGTLRVTAGTCGGGKVSGSTFRMVLPSGNASGPFVSNNDSACSDQTYTLLAPGTDGGLVTGAYQPEPNPGFDGNGNSLAARVTKPVAFYGVAFSTSTNAKDPQTGVGVGAPSLTAQDGKLTGDLRAFAASWNRQEFNQGAPKPDGSRPGNTAAPTGTFDPSTGKFTLTWASQIQGGPFNNFTGVWHLEGTFASGSAASHPAASSSPSTAPSASGAAGKASASATTTTLAGAGAAPTSEVPSGPDASSSTTAATIGGAAAAASKRGSSSSGPLVAVAAILILGGGVGGVFGLRRLRGRPNGAA
ncbi:MAG: hypothetical protein QOI42_430 [Frankiaceae bacterium]|nr:hypothetical protein [Frankiaceae bacterium]